MGNLNKFPTATVSIVVEMILFNFDTLSGMVSSLSSFSKVVFFRVFSFSRQNCFFFAFE